MIFYTFLYFFLFYFIVKERAPECKFKTKISKEILNKAGASNGKWRVSEVTRKLTLKKNPNIKLQRLSD